MTGRGEPQVGHAGRATIGVPELAEPLDRQADRIARLEVPAEGRIPHLEQAARADRPAADEVAGPEPDVGGGAREHLAEAEVRIRPACPG